MKTRPSPRSFRMPTAYIGLAAGAVYGLMVGVTLARIESISGLRPFDMRPAGYSVEEARALLEALGPDGRRYYLTRQIPLDLVYPALMALFLISALAWAARVAPFARLVRAGVWLSVGAAAADYLENIGISLMILGWPEPPDRLIHAASLASVAKSGLTTVAACLVLGLVGVRIYRNRRRGGSAIRARSPGTNRESGENRGSRGSNDHV